MRELNGSESATLLFCVHVNLCHISMHISIMSYFNYFSFGLFQIEYWVYTCHRKSTVIKGHVVERNKMEAAGSAVEVRF